MPWNQMFGTRQNLPIIGRKDRKNVTFLESWNPFGAWWLSGNDISHGTIVTSKMFPAGYVDYANGSFRCPAAVEP
jgi:hypothetical protein